MTNSTIGLVERKFRQLLATGQSVAMEDAARAVSIPEGFDCRALGTITLRLLRDGEIVEAGFRRGVTSRCNQAVKRLWKATDALAVKSREGKSRE